MMRHMCVCVCHADVEFGRIQARDLLQHLWTGPISNAPVEIIQVRAFRTHRMQQSASHELRQTLYML